MSELEQIHQELASIISSQGERFAKKHGMKFHISTQANVSNTESAKYYEDLGAERIILARELSLEQIKLIKHLLSHTEIEVFVHGSMCTSISGRCYFSATICDSEEFSANRGNCVQPCRRQWRVIDDEKNEFGTDMAVLGLKNILFLTENSYLKSTIAMTGSWNKWKYQWKDENGNFYIRTVKIFRIIPHALV